LRVTQRGTGEALRVEDDTTPDSTAFVISSDGRVGIGVTPDATVSLSVDTTGVKFGDGTVQTTAAIAGTTAPLYQATYYKSSNQNLTNGNTDITFDQDAAWSNDNGLITHTSGSEDFVVVQAGLYQLEFNLSVNANAATWNASNSKVVSIDITRSPNAEQVVIGQTALTATTQSYTQSVVSTFKLEVGDVINLRHYGNFATATPFAQGVQNTIDLNTWFSWRFLASGAGAASADVQIFATTGSTTWTKPVGAKSVNVQLFAGGGGGGSGRKDNTAATTKGGGGGGGGGGYLNVTLDASALGSTENITIGAGGASGIAQAATIGNGNAGGSGGNTSFNSLICIGGGGGQGGTLSSGGPGGVAILYANNGGNGSTNGNGSIGTPGSVTSVTQYGGAGGGGGAGISNTSTAFSGGSGGRSNILNLNGGSNGAVGVAGGAGISNANASAGIFAVGSGGGGGGSGIAVSGGAGGTGGFPAGGAGGGGATETGATSGAGGVGGAGMAIITTYF
jgi:hypothetical protein